MTVTEEVKEIYEFLMGKFEIIINLKGNEYTSYDELIRMMHLLVINNKSLIKTKINGNDLLHYLLKFTKKALIYEKYEEFLKTASHYANDEILKKYTVEELYNFTLEDYIKNYWIHKPIRFCDDHGPYQLKEMFKLYFEQN